MPRTITKSKSKIFFIAFFVLTAIILIAGLVVRIRLTEVNDRNASLISEYNELRGKNARLTIEYESSVDLAELEKYAKNVLGMQKTESERIIYIDVETRDKAVVFKDSTETETNKLVGSVLEYLRKVKCKFN